MLYICLVLLPAIDQVLQHEQDLHCDMQAFSVEHMWVLHTRACIANLRTMSHCCEIKSTVTVIALTYLFMPSDCIDIFVHAQQ